MVSVADENGGWEARRAAVQASRLLEIFDEHLSRTEWPHPNPEDKAPLYGAWPAYEPGDVDAWWPLDVVPGSTWWTHGARDTLRRRLFGEPPWRHQPEVPDPEKVGAYTVMLTDTRATVGLSSEALDGDPACRTPNHPSRS